MVEDMTMEEEVVEGVAGIMFTDCLRNGWFPFCDKFNICLQVSCHYQSSPYQLL